MGTFFERLVSGGKRAIRSYKGDDKFLNAVCAASAMVIAADGTVEDSEVVQAINVMMDNEVIKASFTPMEMEKGLQLALNHSKSFSGKAINKRALEDAASRPDHEKQDILLIAADNCQACRENVLNDYSCFDTKR